MRGVEQRGGLRADARSRRRSAPPPIVGGDARRRARDEQLAVVRRVADQEEVERSRCGCRPTSAASTAPGGRLEPADLAQRGAHPVRRAAGARARAPGPSKSSSTASPPHFTSPAPSSYATSEQLRERRVEGVAHLLGTDLATAGEPLGQLGEAGDVDEGQRCRRRRGTGLLGCVAQPVDDQARHVRGELCRPALGGIRQCAHVTPGSKRTIGFTSAP